MAEAITTIEMQNNINGIAPTNDILRILVKAQPSIQSTGPRSPTGLGIRSQDLGLPDEYSLGHCGLSAASRHKLVFTRRHYTLLTATDATALC